MTGPLSLGIDLGTSGVRSAVLDASGAVVAQARGAYGTTPADRRDPEAWWSAARDCLAAQASALAQVGYTLGDVERLAVDGTSGSVVLTDAALTPVGRALMYDDAGFEAEAAIIAAHAPPSHVARGSNSALARVLRLVAEDAGGRARHLLHQADFIAARLMRQGGRTDLNNALKSGLDPATGLWPDWFEGLPLAPALLPRTFAPGAPIAPVAKDVAAELGLAPGVIVHAGTTDSIAAFVASTPIRMGAAVTSLGTTLAVKVMSPRRIDVPEMGLYSHKLGEGWLVGGASNTGGGVLADHFAPEKLALLSARIDPDRESSLDYYPLRRAGERFPVNDPSLTPRLTPRPADDAAFLHGMLEGMARIERRAYRAIEDHGAPFPEEIVTAGGGAANTTWSRIRSRVLGVPVRVSATPEAAIGTARLAQGG
ncbi:MAG: FGGY-family carbohydrate kinase [Shimia sp.]